MALDRLPPPPFWRTRYFDEEVMARPDRQDIGFGDVDQARLAPYRSEQQPDGRFRRWLWVAARRRWLRVIIEPDGETVHNAFWDRNFKP